MQRTLTLLLSVMTAVVLTALPAFAVEPTEAAAAAANDGFYVEPGASISESQAGALVAELRDAGENFVLVVLADEPAAGATTFADNVQFDLGRGLVFVVAPESLGYAGEADVYNEVELENALDAAFEILGSDYEVAAAFVGNLTGVPVATPSDPVPVPTTLVSQTTQVPAASGGGGGNGFIWFIVIVGAIGLFVWWMMRRAKAKRELLDDERVTKARSLIQEQLNDVANDILAMEDEVRVADNERASSFYQSASETYNEAMENLDKTTTAQGLVDLSNKIDVAIWQLDSAEAILDDKPLPQRPEPKRLDPPPPTGQPAPAPPSAPTVPGPSYDRRPERRSSYGGLGGGGLMDLLIVVGGGLLNSRRRAPSSGGGLGDLFGRRSTPPSAPPPSSSGYGSTPVPGPGRPATPSTRSTTPTTSRRGTSGRVRSGRKRRRR